MQDRSVYELLHDLLNGRKRCEDLEPLEAAVVRRAFGREKRPSKQKEQLSRGFLLKRLGLYGLSVLGLFYLSFCFCLGGVVLFRLLSGRPSETTFCGFVPVFWDGLVLSTWGSR